MRGGADAAELVNDGGRAFPWCGDLNECPTINLGMTLRDWFASQSLLAMGPWSISHHASDQTIEEVMVRRAAEAYRQADAMMKARAA